MSDKMDMTLGNRFAAYFAASNKTFALSFPAILALTASLWYLSDSWFWLVPAATAVIEATAKAYELWKRQ